jgi:AcrR family transcriptional regulator
MSIAAMAGCYDGSSVSVKTESKVGSRYRCRMATTATPPATPRTGRPRKPELDAAILQATRELLVEVGYTGLTMQGVARRAGVFAPAIYRRWSSKPELVAAAVFPLEWHPPELTGNLRADLRALVDVTLRLHAEPATRAAIAGLITDSRRDPTIAAQLAARNAQYVGALQALVDGAAARGDLPPGECTHESLLPALIAGAALTISVLSETTIDDTLIDHLTSMLLHGLSGAPQ